MIIDTRNQLLFILLASLLFTPAMALGFIIIRVPFALLQFFLLGYGLTIALFPRRQDIDSVERVSLSIVLSIVVVFFVGFVLNYTPWRGQLYPTLLALTFLMILICGVGWFRCRRLEPDERLLITLKIKSLLQTELGLVDKVLILLLAISLTGAGFAAYQAITNPKSPDKFTEFYLLGPEGHQESCPLRLTAGEQASASTVLGIINREQADAEYEIEIQVDQQLIDQIGPIQLKHGQTWEQRVTFMLPLKEESVKVQFLLFKDQLKQPYRSLHAWIEPPVCKRKR